MQLSNCGKRRVRSVCTADLSGSNGKCALEHVVFISLQEPFFVFILQSMMHDAKGAK